MATNGVGEAWEAVEGALRLRRTVESIDGDGVLVRVNFENVTEGQLATRVIEETPEQVEDVSVATAAGGDPCACRVIGDWIVHDVGIPGEETRTTVYLLDCGGNEPIDLPAPRIEEASSTRPDARVGEKGSTGTRTASASAMAAIGDPVDDETDCDGDGNSMVATGGDGRAEDASVGVSIVDALLEELEGETSSEKRDELRATLGVTPSDRARFSHLQSRLEDLAAYADALELLLDEHGTDAISVVRDALEENAEQTEELAEDVAELRETVQHERSTTADRLDSIEAAVARRGAEVDDRITELEESLGELRDDLDTLQADHRTDRRALATDVRDLDRSLSEITDAIESMESEVTEFETFRERFRAAFSSDSRESVNERKDANGRDGMAYTVSEAERP